jgi:hypothetical protein
MIIDLIEYLAEPIDSIAAKLLAVLDPFGPIARPVVGQLRARLGSVASGMLLVGSHFAGH